MADNGETTKLLQELLAVNRAMARDMQLVRSIGYGPYVLTYYSPGTANPPIVIPATINAQQRLKLVGPADGVGALLFASITLSSLEYRLILERDNETIEFDAAGAVGAKYHYPSVPGLWMTQVDHANGLFTMALTSGSPMGLPFYDGLKIYVRNSGQAAAILLINFAVMVRFVEPLERFKEALTRDRHKR